MEKINLNKSNVWDLMQIIHIGQKRAVKIEQNRPYKDIYELSKVLGLGKKRMEDIIAQDIVTI